MEYPEIDPYLCDQLFFWQKACMQKSKRNQVLKFTVDSHFTKEEIQIIKKYIKSIHYH